MQFVTLRLFKSLLGISSLVQEALPSICKTFQLRFFRFSSFQEKALFVFLILKDFKLLRVS